MEFEDIISQYQDPVLIKQGGQKIVYRVIDPKYGKVALKIGSFSSDANLERIRREVIVLRDIDSIYFPKNYEFKVVPNRRFVILEEYIESIPLSGCFAKYQDVKAALELIKHIIIALNVLWEKRVVHRDVKPDNILIPSSDIPKIIDLGIARLLDLESLTRTAAMRGPCTPFYAAPEQLNNRKTEIDFRTDQFSVGIILMQLLSKGQHPFDPAYVGGDSIIQNIITGNWNKRILEELEPKALKPLIFRLLGPEPYERYRNPIDLIGDIIKILEGLP